MKQRTKQRMLEQIEAEIEAHRTTGCNACTLSVTTFAPVCDIMADLQRRAHSAAGVR